MVEQAGCGRVLAIPRPPRDEGCATLYISPFSNTNCWKKSVLWVKPSIYGSTDRPSYVTLGIVMPGRSSNLMPPMTAASISALFLTIPQHTVGPALTSRATHLLLNFLTAALKYKEIGEMTCNHVSS